MSQIVNAQSRAVELAVIRRLPVALPASSSQASPRPFGDVTAGSLAPRPAIRFVRAGISRSGMGTVLLPARDLVLPSTSLPPTVSSSGGHGLVSQPDRRPRR